jgi:hypothetical protein
VLADSLRQWLLRFGRHRRVAILIDGPLASELRHLLVRDLVTGFPAAASYNQVHGEDHDAPTGALFDGAAVGAAIAPSIKNIN